jgi:hypothetical protein
VEAALVDIARFRRPGGHCKRPGTRRIDHQNRRDRKPGAGGHSTAAVLAMQILFGDKLETSAKSILTVVLIDGSEISLSESSSIVVDRSMVNTANADSFIKLFRAACTL